MLYFSDHAENVDTIFGHSPDFFDISMYKIPMYISISDKYNVKHSNIVNIVKRNRNKYFSNDMVFDSMLGLMGLHNSNSYNCKQDITSEYYNFDLSNIKINHGKILLKDVI